MRPVIHGGDIYQNEIELDFSVNINPFGIPEKVKEAMQESLELCEHYPDIHHAKLIEKIGAHYHIPEEHILCGNGASELFVAVVHAIKPGKIVIPVPSFYGYEKAANVTEAEVSYYEMKERDGFCLTEVFLQELQEDVDLLFLANPNNPVGNTIEDMLLEKICDRCRGKSSNRSTSVLSRAICGLAISNPASVTRVSGTSPPQLPQMVEASRAVTSSVSPSALPTSRMVLCGR